MTTYMIFKSKRVPDPRNIEGVFQVFGHNSEYGVYAKFTGEDPDSSDSENYAMCIDNCHNKELMGIHWPSRTMYTQEYLK